MRYQTIIFLLIAITNSYGAEPWPASVATISYPKLTIINEFGSEEIKIEAVAKLTGTTVNRLKITELSALAWDEDENLLYAVSDQGHIVHLRPVFRHGKLTDIQAINAYALLDQQGNPLGKKDADSEGLALQNSNNKISGDTRLIVSFERWPRLIQYNQQGVMQKRIDLPVKLWNLANYRDKNRALEAVAVHAYLGALVAPEYPLKGEDKAKLGFYALDGIFRSFTAHFPNGALTGMTTLEDGSLVVIERAFGFFSGFKIALHHLQINNNSIEDKVIARFLTKTGTFNDNFEGITQRKKDDYFMISDNNNYPFKQTLLVYFKYPN